EVGWTTVATTRPDLVEPGPWFQWHGDRWVLPEGVDPIASTDVCDQAFVVGRCLGVQFHPELTPSMLDGWLGNGGDEHARALGIDPDLLVKETAAAADAAGERARRLVNTFLDNVATAAV
ncbi:MAG: aminotransferase, partial [Actinomycetota bacterium]|nr:aminotransferase [Actinomycetota bacterium]